MSAIGRLFHEWLADVDARIANILAQRRGEGTALTRNRRAPWRTNGTTGSSRGTRLPRKTGNRRATKFRAQCGKRLASAPGDATFRNPITGIGCCCARAASADCGVREGLKEFGLEALPEQRSVLFPDVVWEALAGDVVAPGILT